MSELEEYTSERNVTIYDRKTKQSHTFHWGKGYSIEKWWQEGNGHCDCNRHLYFWQWEFPEGEEKEHLQCSQSRYIITHIDSEEVDFDEWNEGWEEYEI
jgi:hypothetical protein